VDVWLRHLGAVAEAGVLGNLVAQDLDILQGRGAVVASGE
jgi:hypothetical protein